MALLPLLLFAATPIVPESLGLLLISKTLQPEQVHWIVDGFGTTIVPTLFSPFPENEWPPLELDRAAEGAAVVVLVAVTLLVAVTVRTGGPATCLTVVTVRVCVWTTVVVSVTVLVELPQPTSITDALAAAKNLAVIL
jgi:hypothetical protein